MPSTRVQVDPAPTHPVLHCRVYSTTRDPHYTTTPVNCKPDLVKPTGLGKRFPLVESLYLDGRTQPWIHDARVEVKHDNVIYAFQVYFKRGVALAPNHYDPDLVSSVVIMKLSQRDKSTVVNARRSAEERDMMDFVFEQLSPTIEHFQRTKYFTTRALIFDY